MTSTKPLDHDAQHFLDGEELQKVADEAAVSESTYDALDVHGYCPPPMASHDGTYQVGDVRLFHGDAVAWLRRLPSSSVDLIVTDPAYESLEKHRAVGTTTRLKHSKASSNDWFKIFPNDRFEELFAEMYRVLKRDRHLYLYCDAETMFVAKPIGEAAGFRFWKPIVWDKRKIGMGYHYRSRYEMILFFEKGKRKLNNLSVPDILEEPRVFNGYPTEKPVRVSEILITQSTAPGEVVIDPFMGSGSVGVAAVKNHRHFAGNDLCEEAVGIARTRLIEFGARETLEVGTADVTHTAASWNEAHPVGTDCRYWPVYPPVPLVPPVETTTRSEAWELGDGSPVVLVVGKTGGVALSHLEVILPGSSESKGQQT
jgi:site-specific DNA-methyltransferase (adenine-specific)